MFTQTKRRRKRPRFNLKIQKNHVNIKRMTVVCFGVMHTSAEVANYAQYAFEFQYKTEEEKRLPQNT